MFCTEGVLKITFHTVRSSFVEILDIMYSQALWGELPPPLDADRSLATMDREQMTKLRSLEVEGPRLHQPSSRHQPPSKESVLLTDQQIKCYHNHHKHFKKIKEYQINMD